MTIQKSDKRKKKNHITVKQIHSSFHSKSLSEIIKVTLSISMINKNKSTMEIEISSYLQLVILNLHSCLINKNL